MRGFSHTSASWFSLLVFPFPLYPLPESDLPPFVLRSIYRSSPSRPRSRSVCIVSPRPSILSLLTRLSFLHHSPTVTYYYALFSILHMYVHRSIPSSSHVVDLIGKTRGTVAFSCPLLLRRELSMILEKKRKKNQSGPAFYKFCSSLTAWRRRDSLV